MDKHRFPIIDGQTGFRVIRTSFNEAYQEGKIEFREDGIYLIHEDREWRGYMFMPTYRIEKYDSFPRIHLLRCDVIDKFLNKGIFSQYYDWSNSNTNDIIDRDTNEEYTSQTLNVCSRCKKQLFEDIDDSQDFFELLDKSDQHETQIEVDIFGYARDWPRISKAYRKDRKYTCEECGVKVEQGFDQRFLHVHHIHEKENNNYNNLKCLCILCHKYQDSVHEENFSTAHSIKTISQFIEKYHVHLNQELLVQFKNEINQRI
ncbi:HNH endonuclease [Balneola sp. MJW-20]|uniref:HNH endonuclease n=1 Tax=Gracilimonas aurantiaca TaxID=3234185 RepID=UPI0034677DE6